VPEQYLPEVRKHNAEAPLRAEVFAADPAAPLAYGRLAFIDNAVDASTGTIRLRAQFSNEDAQLWPGQFVNLSLQLYEQPDALVIPAQAVQNGPDGQYVYVIGDDMRAEMRRIKVQRTDAERAIVASGLAKGERVVTRGQLRLGPKIPVQIGKPPAEAS
jgi:multidrug efflux system membrane fusion protein